MIGVALIEECIKNNIYVTALSRKNSPNLIRLPKSKFIDIVECDEYYTTVSFKGKRDPAFFINVLGRMPRHHMTLEEKIDYLSKHGLLEGLKKDPERLEMLLSSGNTYKRGISNDQTCILTCKDRSGYFLIDPVCVGRLETSDLTKTLAGKFASDAIMVTDSHAAYPAFAESEKIQLEQIEPGKHIARAHIILGASMRNTQSWRHSIQGKRSETQQQST